MELICNKLCIIGNIYSNYARREEMFPEEMQGLMAKIIFFIFATCALCLTRVRADEASPSNLLTHFSHSSAIVYSVQNQK